VKVALLGAGRIGRIHGRHLAADPRIDRVLVHDPAGAAARALAAEIGGQVVDAADEAIERADGVVIAAATSAHPSLVRAAVARRRPTFVEKPLAFDLDESASLTDLIERDDVPVQVGFQRRFDPAYREMRRVVESGELGRVYLVRLVAHDAAPPPDAYVATSGGLFRDSTIHDFDAVRFVTGREVVEVVALGTVRVAEIFARHGDVDTAAAILTMSDGSLAVLSQTRHDPRGYDIRMEVVGSGDAVSVGVGPRTPSRSLEPGAGSSVPGWEGFTTRFETAYRNELEAFVDVVRGLRPPAATARDALEAMRVAVAATRSLRDGRAVRVADVTTEIAESPATAAPFDGGR
jgi:myo-inositol 2-dehydrogenase/D-chiro-inositol 1-dehydrogenase